MALFLFISVPDPDKVAFTPIQDGANLPPQHAPWRRATGGGAVKLGDKQTPARSWLVSGGTASTWLLAGMKMKGRSEPPVTDAKGNVNGSPAGHPVQRLAVQIVVAEESLILPCYTARRFPAADPAAPTDTAPVGRAALTTCPSWSAGAEDCICCLIVSAVSLI
jgi:hypothetical protein